MEHSTANYGADVVRARFAIVTPMFLGGARQEAESIRPPSVKGALRFWWRALNWGRVRGKHPRDVAALQALHGEEARLFGMAGKTVDNRQVGGQGEFLLSVKHENLTPCQPEIPRFSGLAYMAGMGLDNRWALPRETKFDIFLRFRPGCSQEDRNDIVEALRLFALVGGLGSRSRRGYGSVVRMVEQGDGWRLPTGAELQAEIEWLEGVIRTIPSQIAPFSALTGNATLKLRSSHATAEAALEAEGKKLNRYRTNGTAVVKDKSGTTLETAKPGHRILEKGKPQVPIGQLNFWTDHNHVHAIASTGKVVSPHDIPPERVIFGLPHPYRFSSLGGRKVSYDFIPSWDATDAKGRRASPLFVHIVAFQENGKPRYRPILLLLPAKFLPNGERLRVSVDGADVGDVNPPINDSAIQRYL
jgi:CRISPR-associated protein Cmr1